VLQNLILGFFSKTEELIESISSWKRLQWSHPSSIPFALGSLPLAMDNGWKENWLWG